VAKRGGWLGPGEQDAARGGCKPAYAHKAPRPRPFHEKHDFMKYNMRNMSCGAHVMSAITQAHEAHETHELPAVTRLGLRT